jgi:hypothetical protein
MKKPTFFLSSTIFDFHDLRSAIKYTLEQRGCLVLASEFNDFRKPLDRHSYEACLESIKQADYFVLLIGSRVGGWYDEPSRISITQQEYRAAYELQRAGKLQILSFVRADVWQFRDDHKALLRHLQGLSLDNICKFIEEVGRNRETASAVHKSDPFPTGNWLHVFQNFRDIADVFQTLFLKGFPADEAAFRRALRHELVEILRGSLIRNKKGEVFGPHFWVSKFDAAFDAPEGVRQGAVLAVPTAAWDSFSTIMMHWLRGKLQAFILREALMSSTFLHFDPHTGSCEETEVFKALFKLEQEIRGVNQMLDDNALVIIFEHTPKARGGMHPPEIYIDGMQLLRLIGLSLRWVNIVQLTTAIVAHLDGAAFVMPALTRFSPIKGYDAKIAAEVPSDEGIAAYMKSVAEAGASQ